MGMFGKSTEKEIGGFEDKLAQLRGTRAQFAQKHVEAVASRREALQNGTPDLGTLDKLSTRIAGIESTLTELDQQIESTGVALVNVKARRDEEVAARDRKSRAVALEGLIEPMEKSFAKLDASTSCAMRSPMLTRAGGAWSRPSSQPPSPRRMPRPPGWRRVAD
jgi:hypothetical protein